MKTLKTRYSWRTTTSRVKRWERCRYTAEDSQESGLSPHQSFTSCSPTRSSSHRFTKTRCKIKTEIQTSSHSACSSKNSFTSQVINGWRLTVGWLTALDKEVSVAGSTATTALQQQPQSQSQQRRVLHGHSSSVHVEANKSLTKKEGSSLEPAPLLVLQSIPVAIPIATAAVASQSSTFTSSQKPKSHSLHVSPNLQPV